MIVGVVGNPRYADLATVLRHLAEIAPRLGLSICSEERLAQHWPKPVPGLEGARLDALVTFGGDGTLLRGARLLAGAEVPILGINLGKVGFLTTAGRDDLNEAMSALVERRYAIEKRQALAAVVHAPDGTVDSEQRALNDVVVHKGGIARVVRFNIFIDGENVGPFSGDGVVVATPTGSTAYSLSAGGPIIVPGVEALCVTPVCAHTLAVRPLVVPATATIVIEPMTEWEDDLLVSFDGQTSLHLAMGARITVRRAGARVCLVRMGEGGYIQRMRQKLHWGDLSDRENGG